MNATRGLALLRLCTKVHKNSLLHNKFENIVCLQQKRWHGDRIYTYRKLPPENAKDTKLANICSAFTWWWILWHLFTEYEELIGVSIPDPSKWTNEELGIPSS